MRIPAFLLLVLAACATAPQPIPSTAPRPVRELHRLVQGRLPRLHLRELALGATLDSIVRGSNPGSAGLVLCSTGSGTAAFESASTCGLATTTVSIQTPTLTNSWVNFGAPYRNAGYWKDSLGRVMLRGLVKSGAVGTSIFTLPTGYRPSATAQFAVNSYNGTTNGYALIEVASTGTVTVQVALGTSAVSLDGIAFDTN